MAKVEVDSRGTRARVGALETQVIIVADQALHIDTLKIAASGNF